MLDACNQVIFGRGLFNGPGEARVSNHFIWNEDIAALRHVPEFGYQLSRQPLDPDKRNEVDHLRLDIRNMCSGLPRFDSTLDLVTFCGIFTVHDDCFLLAAELLEVLEVIPPCCGVILPAEATRQPVLARISLRIRAACLDGRLAVRSQGGGLGR
ncbi:uncharacterized protein BJX67DRAFT_334932 [Aspergillus lucknowensis]|uniref:Methyltransferase type 11 domain-containing protein n=1 Tax=Aspergillus lucknowensis TaxID=176173 RepID=A0ABR4L6H1_9EURO